MHVDPAVKVLADTVFPVPGVDGPHVPNGQVDMPVLWTKMYGKGRVFYSSIGHQVSNVKPSRISQSCGAGSAGLRRGRRNDK